MKNIKNILEDECDIIRKRLAETAPLLEDVPRSVRNTRLRRKDKKNGFYIFTIGKNGQQHIVHENDLKSKERVEQVMDYRFYKCERAILENNLRSMEKCIDGLKDYTEEDILSYLPKTYRGTPWARPQKDRLIYRLSDPDWVDQNNEQNDYFPEKRIYPTETGIMVRSKSEADIADAMWRKGIIYRYEPRIPVTDNGIPTYFYPDFEVRTGEDEGILIEHLGRMDDPEYVRKNLHKIDVYRENGYLPGQNLFVTSETKEHPLTKYDIDALIEMLKCRVHYSQGDPATGACR